MSSVDCDRLIMNGDIIDGWQLKNSSDKWTVVHSAFFYVIMKMMEKHSTEVIYVTGNHDDFLDPLVPSKMANITLVNEYIIKEKNHSYVVIHGTLRQASPPGSRFLRNSVTSPTICS